ncbi:MAG: ABC transporter permease [Anaerolineae bacterium]
MRDLFTGGDEIVISQNLADLQGIAVGDTVRVSNTTDLYTVRGIVSADIDRASRTRWLLSSASRISTRRSRRSCKYRCCPTPSA